MVSKKEVFVLGLVATLIITCFTFIVINEGGFINEEEGDVVDPNLVVVCVDCEGVYDVVTRDAWTTKLSFTRGDES